ncbi:5-oxoprolinase subunit PxpB [Chryseosolibacter indicus]|uniref:5-oxoprolinase subunit PxpB n=1 Tax=Chryseosolibacter indicus TaxID=2782351 RepID=A0ABS5VSH1_9BACT|nr:5-oxoprolinase subunit PxpB [Chryseosolibacter indicus]MBT1704383.1 5-oxoprolinase subunit PxpB [Chryseosolibacter indicus]
MASYKIFPCGDQGITIQFGNQIISGIHQRLIEIKHIFEFEPFVGLRDVIVAYSSLTIIYDSFRVSQYYKQSSYQYVKQKLEEVCNLSSAKAESSSPLKRIPVCYNESFGLDLKTIASSKKLSVEEVIELHTTTTYHVFMIGFLPGFPYMASINEKLVMPRKTKPRQQIPAGSVGIAGLQTGIYPVISPGGWQILGRTPLSLFSKEKDNPVLLRPGDDVQFYPITKDEFIAYKE